MVRFLHTADWQLGMKVKMLGESADRVREVRLKTARNLIEKTLERSVDFVIIAGDVFENNAVERHLITRVLEIFEEASRIPIYLLPGNHDPLTPDSIYKGHLWKSAPNNVFLLDQKRPYPVKELNVILYPCPIEQKVSRLDPTAWIKYEEDERDKIRIGVAHGALDIEGMVSNPNFPINPRRAEEAGLDYLALGDWHSLFRYKGKDGIERTIYSGTPEPTAFDERNSGKAVFVKIEEPGSPPQIEEFESANLRWFEWEREITNPGQIADLREKIENISEPQNTLLRIGLRGVADLGAHLRVNDLRKLGREILMHFEVETNRFYLKPDIGEIGNMIAGSIFRRTAESLEALMTRWPLLSQNVDVAPDLAEERLKEIKGVKVAMEADPNVTQHVIQRAVSKLYEIAKGVKE
ncbi:MAG: putative metallophosphoesterase YhaO [Dehalococcoidia bacterium]|nr:putative metallophosphoesterase YhaO [Bacillota bacterium]MBT9142684.1 putative metallophosphoesterase YhaO [Bacillota bacterium]